jgi:ParB family transcriptional regulator, chromosome partitioning protein
MSDSDNKDQSGKPSGRKLGRGLSALLGTPIEIGLPKGAPRIPITPEVLYEPRAARLLQETVEIKPPSGAEATNTPKSTPASNSAPTEQGKSSEKQDVGRGVLPGEIRSIPTHLIVPNRRQPRKTFDEDSIARLAESIAHAGLMQPILVRPIGSGFELIAGERRWRAANRLGLREIPAIVSDVSEQVSAELALIENLQREELNPMDRAHALRHLCEDFGLTHQELADRVGLDRASVTNLLRLSDLDPLAADFVRSGRLSQGHGKALLAVMNLNIRHELAGKAATAGWSVRELERRIQHVLIGSATKAAQTDPTHPATTPRSANAADLERKLGEHLGTRVNIQLGRKKGSGRLIIEFYSLDQFDGLMARFGFDGSRM